MNEQKEKEIVNGKIEYAKVGMGGYQDAMVNLTVHVKLSTGFSAMVEGHCTDYLPPSFKNHSQKSLLAHIIYLWLEATGANDINGMVGKTVRLEMEKGLGSAIPFRVGHIVEDDKWFSTGDLLKAAYPKENE